MIQSKPPLVKWSEFSWETTCTDKIASNSNSSEVPGFCSVGHIYYSYAMEHSLMPTVVSGLIYTGLPFIKCLYTLFHCCRWCLEANNCHGNIGGMHEMHIGKGHESPVLYLSGVQGKSGLDVTVLGKQMLFRHIFDCTTVVLLNMWQDLCILLMHLGV